MIPVKASVVISHIVAWILFLSLPVLFVNGQSGNPDLLSILSSPYTWLFFLTYIFIFYFNSRVLLPKLFQAKRYIVYVATLFVMLAAIWLIKPFDRLVSRRNNPPIPMEQRAMPPPGGFRMPSPGKPPGLGKVPGHKLVRVDVVSIFLYIMVLAMSMAIFTRQQLRLAEQRALQAEADRANAELSFLKAQIHPHFLFNTLNNIYSLATSKSEHTAESILKLSNIMRYVTDDVMEEFVPLENEVAFISDYIDLQRLRLGKRTSINFRVSGEITGKKIAPLILMTFIENLFKYGVSAHEPGSIDIELRAENNVIRFYCSNRIYETKRMEESTGIGISNTQKRLEHLYPGKHELLIRKENGLHSVVLTLRA